MMNFWWINWQALFRMRQSCFLNFLKRSKFHLCPHRKRFIFGKCKKYWGSFSFRFPKTQGTLSAVVFEVINKRFFALDRKMNNLVNWRGTPWIGQKFWELFVTTLVFCTDLGLRLSQINKNSSYGSEIFHCSKCNRIRDKRHAYSIHTLYVCAV